MAMAMAMAMVMAMAITQQSMLSQAHRSGPVHRDIGGVAARVPCRVVPPKQVRPGRPALPQRIYDPRALFLGMSDYAGVWKNLVPTERVNLVKHGY